MDRSYAIVAPFECRPGTSRFIQLFTTLTGQIVLLAIAFTGIVGMAYALDAESVAPIVAMIVSFSIYVLLQVRVWYAKARFDLDGRSAAASFALRVGRIAEFLREYPEVHAKHTAGIPVLRRELIAAAYAHRDALQKIRRQVDTLLSIEETSAEYLLFGMNEAQRTRHAGEIAVIRASEAKMAEVSEVLRELYDTAAFWGDFPRFMGEDLNTIPLGSVSLGASDLELLQ